MPKRAAVRLTDEEHALLMELSELRGQTVSKILGDVIEAVTPTWKRELQIRRRAATKEEAAAELEALAQRKTEEQLELLNKERS